MKGQKGGSSPLVDVLRGLGLAAIISACLVAIAWYWSWNRNLVSLSCSWIGLTCAFCMPFVLGIHAVRSKIYR